MSIKRYLYSVLLLLFCFVQYGFANKNQPPIAKTGVIDLRGQSFTSNIELNGQWEFYWDQLINPMDTATGNAELVNFPFLWTEPTLKGKTYPSYGYATYKLQILLSKDAPPLRLEMPDLYSAYALYINGKMALSDGKVTTTAEGFIPHWEIKFLNLDTGKDTLNFVLHVANFAHSKAGVKKPLIIGEKTKIGLERRRTEAIDLLLTGCLFMGGLFFLGLYLLGNRDKATLLFALYSIVYSYRIMGVDNYVLHTIIPNTSWYITARLEYLSLFMGIGLFGLYTRYLYPEDVHHKIVTIVSLICFTFGLTSLVLPPLYFTQLVNPFLIVTIFCILYVPYVYIKAYKKNRPGAVYALASTIALMFIFTITLFHYWSVIPQLQLLSFACYVSFFFLQSLVLSHRVSFVLKKARHEAELGLIAKSEFLSTMSHEIRTPLNAVIGMSHLLLKNNPREDQRKELDVMLFSANNLLAIVNDILDYNKIEAGKITFEHIEMDIASIARNIVSGLQSAAHDKNIELNLKIDPSLKNKLLGDPTRTSQIITNLVHNAIKFTKEGYVEVNISVKDQTETKITLKTQIKDTGIGISMEKQKLIFERFTQADSSTSRGFGGTGLGLAICKKLLELQHSSLHLNSKEGKGSTFYFIQTFEKSIKTTEQQIKDNNSPNESDKPFAGVSILLVEDNEMNVLVAQNFLKRWGADVDVAINGLEALNMLDVDKHNLVLMDLHMPVMDGYQASSKMRENGVTLPIIALTANLPNEIEERVKQSGIDNIVVKPFLPDELYRKVLHHLSLSK
ncbi:ATP-binding protein [Pedobacter frigoris]|uniref:histidine kinase n=1 Tax=Pedobacter frigoris TaxID=2571272 RepID=A0A4U1CJK2_9SPHI|nr:ATP-binding protein [Pedobacter frigoris]TKC05086.1 response regulator [Pedobacter frigoris]